MAVATRREILLASAAALLALPAGSGKLAAKSANALAPSEWDFATADALVAALRARNISALELADRTIARIEALDQRINAVVVRDFARAHAAARAADAALARGAAGALLGVPVTVKESFDIAGLPTSWGDPRFRHFMPQHDAVAVARLRAAGAVILGKTNVPRWLADWQSYNDLHGVTCNPWDAARTPGGSSGGSAAALACGFGALSLGSDIGGSLRVPAHYCGVFAHRPTFGLVPRRGHQPPGVPRLPGELDLATVGPMARSAADLALMLDVIAGPDPEESGAAYRLALPPPRLDKVADCRVIIIDSHPLVPTAASVRGAIADVRDKLARAGARVAESSPLLPDLGDATRLFVRLLSSQLGADLPPPAYARMLRQADALAANDRSLAAERLRGAVLGHGEWLAADDARARLKQQWRALFDEWDLVLCPVAPTPAFRHDHAAAVEARRLSIDGRRFSYVDAEVAWPAIAAVAGLPATVAPIGRTPSGLPVGIEIIGPAFADRSTIAFAGLLERAFGGFTPPPDFR
jgi:amidase